MAITTAAAQLVLTTVRKRKLITRSLAGVARLVPCVRVAAWLLLNGQSIMNVLPIVGRRVSWIDAERFHGIDGLEDFFDLGPTGETQERFSARTHIRDCGITLAWSHRSQNIDARKGRAIVIRSPANEREYAPGDE